VLPYETKVCAGDLCVYVFTVVRADACVPLCIWLSLSLCQSLTHTHTLSVLCVFLCVWASLCFISLYLSVVDEQG
jgi:hypothetical protein